MPRRRRLCQSRRRRRGVEAPLGMPHYRCNTCMVVTNSRFISAAIKAAALPFCTLVDRMELTRWLAEVKTVIATAGR